MQLSCCLLGRRSHCFLRAAEGSHAGYFFNSRYTFTGAQPAGLSPPLPTAPSSLVLRLQMYCMSDSPGGAFVSAIYPAANFDPNLFAVDSANGNGTGPSSFNSLTISCGPLCVCLCVGGCVCV